MRLPYNKAILISFLASILIFSAAGFEPTDAESTSSTSYHDDILSMPDGDDSGEDLDDDCDEKCPDAKKKKSKSKSKSKAKKGGSSSTTPVPAKDTTPPAVTIISPANGATVSGSLQISATASDNKGVTKVEFYYGSKLIGTDIASPYSVQWDPKSVPNGTYSITVKAYDTSGNSASSSISVKVNYPTASSPATYKLSVSKFDGFYGFLVYESNKLGTYDVSIDHGNGTFYIESMKGSINVSVSHKSSSGTSTQSFLLPQGQYKSINVLNGNSLLITLSSSSAEFAFVFDPAS
jgi:hypothetical protein